MKFERRATHLSVGLLAMCLFLSRQAAAAEPVAKPSAPEVGAAVEDFKLPGLGDKPVELAKLAEGGPVVVIVLRGYPGYQCPVCSAQYASFGEHAKDFAALKATVLFIYPGEEKLLTKRAEEFLKGKKLGPPFVIALDPSFKLVTKWALRWNEPGETAYPSTFVLDQDRKVKWRKISREHGDRADAKDVLAALKGK